MQILEPTFIHISIKQQIKLFRNGLEYLDKGQMGQFFTLLIIDVSQIFTHEHLPDLLSLKVWVVISFWICLDSVMM